MQHGALHSDEAAAANALARQLGVPPAKALGDTLRSVAEVLCTRTSCGQKQS